MGGAREADQLTAGPRRLGISIPVDQGSLSGLPQLVRRAEALGFTDAWSMEVNGFDAFSPLAAAAAVTERMRLGTAIVPAYTRPAGLIAMHAAALAGLAPGRFVLGIGSSTRVVVETWMGIEFGRPVTKVRETVTGVRALLGGEPLGALRLARPPEGSVPIYVAALGEKMLQAAGEVGDGVIFFLAGPRILPGLLAATGRQLDSVARIPILPGDPAAGAAAGRRLLSTYALVPHYARLLERQGFGEEVAAIQGRWKAGERAEASGQVSGAMLDELVLRGDAERIAEGVRRYWEAGLATPVLAVAAPDPLPLLERLTPVAIGG